MPPVALSAVVSDLPYQHGDNVALMINGLGGTPISKLYLLYGYAHEQLAVRGINVRRSYVGEYCTSLDMAGASLTLVKLDDELEQLLAARAGLFPQKGKITPVFVRFSSVIHGGHSPETLRDPRGFATKFYTEDGNWDLVGNNLKVFFIRDPIKFPDLVHAFKPDPVTNRQDVNRIFDFISQTPEAMHMITWLFSPWGIPASYRCMEGSGVNTYKMVNSEGVGLCGWTEWLG